MVYDFIKLPTLFHNEQLMYDYKASTNFLKTQVF